VPFDNFFTLLSTVYRCQPRNGDKYRTKSCKARFREIIVAVQNVIHVCTSMYFNSYTPCNVYAAGTCTQTPEA
jgi:hypothetical protein